MITTYKFHNEFHYVIIDDVDDLFYFLRENSDFSTFNISSAFSAGQGRYIYRGHSCYEWLMVPSALRTYNALEDFCFRIWAEPTTKYSKYRDLVEYIIQFMQSEVISVKYFLESAEEQGITTVLDYQQFTRQFKEIYDRLDLKFRSCPNLLNLCCLVVTISFLFGACQRQYS